MAPRTILPRAAARSDAPKVATNVPVPNALKRTVLGNIQNVPRNVPAKTKQVLTNVRIPIKKPTGRPPRPVRVAVKIAPRQTEPAVIFPAFQPQAYPDPHRTASEEPKADVGNKCSAVVELPDGVRDIDNNHDNDGFQSYEYSATVFSYLRRLELKYTIRKDFLSEQTEINVRHRMILVDWLHQVHSQFKLLDETFYMAIALVDLFLQRRVLPKYKFQLLGITALFIASKYEEVQLLDIGEYSSITDDYCSKQDIVNMEFDLLKTLDFRVNRPLPIHFLRRYSQASDCGTLVHTLGKYFLELSLQNHELARLSPSLLAAGASALAMHVVDQSPWSPSLSYYSGYEACDVHSVSNSLAELVTQAGSSKFQAVHSKYARGCYLRVSGLPLLQCISKI